MRDESRRPGNADGGDGPFFLLLQPLTAGEKEGEIGVIAAAVGGGMHLFAANEGEVGNLAPAEWEFGKWAAGGRKFGGFAAEFAPFKPPLAVVQNFLSDKPPAPYFSSLSALLAAL